MVAPLFPQCCSRSLAHFRNFRESCRAHAQLPPRGHFQAFPETVLRLKTCFYSLRKPAQRKSQENRWLVCSNLRRGTSFASIYSIPADCFDTAIQTFRGAERSSASLFSVTGLCARDLLPTTASKRAPAGAEVIWGCV